MRGRRRCRTESGIPLAEEKVSMKITRGIVANREVLTQKFAMGSKQMYQPLEEYLALAVVAVEACADLWPS